MPVAPAAGRVLAGKYRLLERVGVGGMSEVYRAEDIDDGRIVALKLLLHERSDDANLGARLVHEAQSVIRIRHPSIVEVFEVGQSDVGPFIVMEYLRGASAAGILNERGRFGLQATLATVFPVLDALNAAHEAGIIHRDIKPGNVFFAVDSKAHLAVKLLDFGVAKTIWPTGPTPKTSTGVVMGTPDYLSPEQANGEWNIDGRSDLFAMGVLTFELLTATRPFHAPSAVATAYKIAHARTPLLKDHDGPNSDTLQAILERALAKRPDERHGSALELGAELRTLAGTDAALDRALRELVRPERFASGSGEQPSARAISLRGSTAPEGPMARRLSQPEVQVTGSPAITPERILSRRTSFGEGTPSSGALRRADTMPDTSKPFGAHTPTPSGVRALGMDLESGQHVRGVVLRAVDKHVIQTFGHGPREHVLATLPKEIAQELEYSALQAIVLYNLAAVNRYFDTVTNDICSSNPSWARTAGIAAVPGSISQILRAALRPGDLPVVLRRVVPVYSRLFDFGSWEVEATPLGATMRVGDFEHVSLSLRLWLVGALEGTLAACDVRSRTTIARGDVAHAPHLIVERRFQLTSPARVAGGTTSSQRTRQLSVTPARETRVFRKSLKGTRFASGHWMPRGPGLIWGGVSMPALAACVPFAIPPGQASIAGSGSPAPASPSDDDADSEGELVLRGAIHPQQLFRSQATRTLNLGAGYRLGVGRGKSKVHGPYAELGYFPWRRDYRRASLAWDFKNITRGFFRARCAGSGLGNDARSGSGNRQLREWRVRRRKRRCLRSRGRSRRGWRRALCGSHASRARERPGDAAHGRDQWTTSRYCRSGVLRSSPNFAALSAFPG